MKKIHILALILLAHLCLYNVFAEDRVIEIDTGDHKAVKLTYGKGQIHPSVIRIPDWVPIEKRINPKAKYYMYVGVHAEKTVIESAYIKCFWAESPLGTWKETTELKNVLQARQIGDYKGYKDWEMSSPDVHIDHENKRFIMYFHGTFKWFDKSIKTGHISSKATSPDGLDWGDPDMVDPETGLKKIKEMYVGGPYYRAFEHNGVQYGIAQGISSKTNRQTSLYRKSPVTPDEQKQVVDGSVKEEHIFERKHFDRTNWRNFGVVVRGDYAIIFHNRIWDFPERIKAVVYHMKSELLSEWELLYSDSPIEVYRPTEDWEYIHHLPKLNYRLKPTYSKPGKPSGAQLQCRSPFVFEDIDDNGKLRTYLYYAWQGEWGIGGIEINIKQTAADANTAPVISDLTSTSATIGLSPNVTSLSVSATDAEGDELSYNWSVSGPGSYTIGNGKSTVEASFKSVGTYTITVQVSDGNLTSSKSTEIKVVNTAPVISNLSATSSSIGVSPDSTSLSVTATDAEGDELSYNWSVSGPGSYTIENSKSTVEASFKSAGTYKATVVVSDGNLTSSKSIEIDVVDSTNDPIFTDKGTLEITQENSGSWKTVELTKEYVDPVIIMSPLTYNGGNPAVVRVNNVTNKSFDFQVEEWDYLDGYHTKENVQYIVLEAGEYELSGGRKLIAGNVNVRDDFSLKYFNEELKDDVPVVLTQIISENDSSTAVVRLQNVSYKSFEVKLQSQESFKKSHSEEKVSFLAIDSGAYDEMGIKAVGKITDKVRHSWYKFEYQQEFTDVPNFFASIQTTKGEDPVALRVKDATAISINVKLEEEQSKDKEIRHTKEDIGYILFNLK